MIAIQTREPQGLDPTPRREHMLRVGCDEAVNPGSDLQTSSDAQDERQMSERTNLLDGHGHDAPPMVAGLNCILAQSGLLS